MRISPDKSAGFAETYLREYWLVEGPAGGGAGVHRPGHEQGTRRRAGRII